MKMYREMLRKLTPVALPLALATFIYTVIVSGQNYFGSYTIEVSQSPIGLLSVLVYYSFSAVLFALYGFSFLFKRSASDLYHSLPVSRLNLYLSITLATATWMGATILANALITLGMLLISGCPFVGGYIALDILFFFVASMLIFAAAAIGCAVSGTIITALASTGIVLFLPRFIQFIIARGLVAQVPIIGWLDLDPWLNPMTNVATGMVVMQTRQMYISRIVDIRYILVSMVPMALELMLGGYLFVRRPSELADRGAGHKYWVVAVASLFSLVAMLLITIDGQKLVSMYGAALMSIAFLVFVVYQFLASRSVRQVAMSVPCFLVAAALAFGTSAAIGAVVKDALSTTPTADEIAYVTFRGHDEKADTPEYTTLMLNDITYSSSEMRQYVAESLRNATERISDPELNAYDVYSQYQGIEPITVTLKDGRTFKRGIEFKNIDALNSLREEDTFFQAAIRALPTKENIQYLVIDSQFTKEETQLIWDCYVAESQKLGLVNQEYYRSRDITLDDNGYSVDRGGHQLIKAFSVGGHVGAKRFFTSYYIRMEMPETTSLIMETINRHSKADTAARLASAVRHMVSPLTMENESISLDMNVYNLPLGNGEPITQSVNIYFSGYTKQNDRMIDIYKRYIQEFTNILQRGTLTKDPSAMFVRLDWYEYDGTASRSQPEPTSYLAFSPDDQKLLTSLVDEWQTDTMY